MRLSIDSNEVKQILEMHSKLRKKGLLEQDVDNAINPKLAGNTEEPKIEVEVKKEDTAEIEESAGRKKRGFPNRK